MAELQLGEMKMALSDVWGQGLWNVVQQRFVLYTGNTLGGQFPYGWAELPRGVVRELAASGQAKTAGTMFL
jgi:hypothetical protein